MTINGREFIEGAGFVAGGVAVTGALEPEYYLRLVAVEEAFKTLNGDLAIRPIFHQRERRIEAYIFIAFLAYCLHVTWHRPTSTVPRA